MKVRLGLIVFLAGLGGCIHPEFHIRLGEKVTYEATQERVEDEGTEADKLFDVFTK